MGKGGYKIISLQNVNFDIEGATTTDTHIIKGIYESIENNYRKNILLTDIVIGNIERSERFIVFGVSNSDYLGYMVISDAVSYTITITDEDSVTIVKN